MSRWTTLSNTDEIELIKSFLIFPETRQLAQHMLLNYGATESKSQHNTQQQPLDLSINNNLSFLNSYINQQTGERSVQATNRNKFSQESSNNIQTEMPSNGHQQQAAQAAAAAATVAAHQAIAQAMMAAAMLNNNNAANTTTSNGNNSTSSSSSSPSSSTSSSSSSSSSMPATANTTTTTAAAFPPYPFMFPGGANPFMPPPPPTQQQQQNQPFASSLAAIQQQMAASLMSSANSTASPDLTSLFNMSNPFRPNLASLAAALYSNGSATPDMVCLFINFSIHNILIT